MVYIFAGLVSLPSLASAIRTAVRDFVCGGVVIEDTADKFEIRCEPALGVGTVVIRSADGTRIERFEEVHDPSPLLNALRDFKGST